MGVRQWAEGQFFRLMRVSGWLALAAIVLTSTLAVPFGESLRMTFVNDLLIAAIVVVARLEGRWWR
jgi:hypothetical protein